ncbi:MAG: hypothetical protein M3619_00640 [Myxococcota bacterium]|nr:hypothetical protein [Myxococcota bacterium]
MPHVYDTGLAIPQRTAIRDAILAKLAPLKKTAVPAAYVAANGIKTLPRPLRGAGDDDGMTMLANAMQGQAPAIAVALGRLTYEGGGTSSTEVGAELEVVLYVASAHQRSPDAGRLFGDVLASASNSNDPGIFTMLEHVRERVLGQSLGVAGVGVLVPAEEDEVYTGDDATIWEQRYTLSLDVPINPFRAVTQLLTSIQGEHELDEIADGHALDPLVTTIATIPPEV